MEEAPENGKESSNSAHANGMNERIFHWHNPSFCFMALALTQPLTEMSTRNISWGVKVASA